MDPESAYFAAVLVLCTISLWCGVTAAKRTNQIETLLKGNDLLIEEIKRLEEENKCLSKQNSRQP